MTDYTELIKALRWCSVDEYVPCTGCPMNEETHGTGCFNIMHQRAAAAIEDMAKHITEMHERVTVLQIARGELEAEVERLEPKHERTD